MRKINLQIILNWAGFVLLSWVLVACDAGNTALRKGNPYAPNGIPARGRSVDGMLVGHRLMAAGEYELALKSYYRAVGKQGLNADTYSALGSANLKLGRLGQAEKLLRMAIEEDQKFPPAWNNLGVVLMERGKFAEARRVFRTAFALDSGESDSIRENLRLAIAKTEDSTYTEPDNDNRFQLVRRGGGDYLLLPTP